MPAAQLYVSDIVRLPITSLCCNSSNGTHAVDREILFYARLIFVVACPSSFALRYLH